MSRSWKAVFTEATGPDGGNSARPRSPRTQSRSRRMTPRVEGLEGRVVLSSLPLHVSGTQLLNSANQAVVLRGVDVAGMEWRPDGNNTLLAESTAINTWHANLIRLPLNEDFWFGVNKTDSASYTAPDPGGANYRALVDSVVAYASQHNAYVMLDLHWSNMNGNAANDNQHDLPDQDSTLFWQSVAARYANNSAALFDPYNEPHLDDSPTSADWNLWRNGGTVNEGGVLYQSPGLQGLINTIRATGARNIVAPEGLDWGSNLAGVAGGFGLSDPAGDLMYQFHIYPSDAPTPSQGDAIVAPVAGKTPIYIGEWGGTVNGGGAGSVANPTSYNTQMVAWLNSHSYNWTAWNMWSVADGGNSFALIEDWNTLTPTPEFGAIVKAGLDPAPANAAPTVATVARASISPVSGKTTNLTVLGADDHGEANLTYTWATLGTPPAGVAFSANGTNAAKATTATFARAGAYSFLVTIKDSGGLTATSTVNVTVSQTPTGVSITPATTSVTTGAKQQFAATVNDQFGNPLAKQPAFTWSATGGGSINASGLYTAPATAGAATVTATAASLNLKGTWTFNDTKPGPVASVSCADTDDWGTGFTGLITITNKGATAINGWTLQFNFAGTIASNTTKDIWDAQLISHVGTLYTIENASWNGTIGAGQSVSFGFNASWNGTHVAPTNYVVYAPVS